MNEALGMVNKRNLARLMCGFVWLLACAGEGGRASGVCSDPGECSAGQVCEQGRCFNSPGQSGGQTSGNGAESQDQDENEAAVDGGLGLRWYCLCVCASRGWSIENALLVTGVYGGAWWVAGVCGGAH